MKFFINTTINFNINNICLIIMILLLKNNFIYSQIDDDFSRGVLEEGNYELLDVTDYHDLKIIVTTSKNIYKGIPPQKTTSTNAKLINATSIITINENYLFAACLQDSLLTKINLKNGLFSSLLSYSDINSGLEIPITSCSLSLIDDYIFIGYSRIDSYSTSTNKTNILIKMQIAFDSGNDPIINTEFEKIIFTFPKSTIKTNSSRQISCEALRLNNKNDGSYRLICIHEDLEYDDAFSSWRYFYYASTVNENFTEFDNGMNNLLIYKTNETAGFRFYKYDEKNGRMVVGRRIFNIYITLNGAVKVGSKGVTVKDYNAEMDLFDFRSDFLFHVEKANFTNKINIYSFRIYKVGFNNYFKLYDYNENYIKKILCYYNESSNIIYIVYQCTQNIKYISLKYIENIYNINSYSQAIKMKTYENIEYDISELYNDLNYGKLNVEGITRNISGSVTTENFGLNYSQLLINNNILVPEKSFNTWYKYSLSFIEHVEDDYTRIYYLNDVNINVTTCYSQECVSCWENYNQCDDCGNGEYALLRDNPDECYKIDTILKGYVYDDTTKCFEKCYYSCDYCSASSDSSSSHKCEVCADGYLLSYSHLGNCYSINDLQIQEEKEIDNNNEKYISTICSENKIESTGECIDECPISSPFYSYEYDSINEIYKKTNLIVPKYLFNKVCYEECPLNSIPDDTNICKCKFAFHIVNDVTTCYSDLICISDYPYQNKDTNQCFSSLNECDFFFNNDCYNQCPDDKNSLSTKSEEIKYYYKENLLLDSDLLNKLCICDISNGVWSNITESNQQYFQECLSSCPEGYEPEIITNQCLKKIETPTTQITTVPKNIVTTQITTAPKNIVTTQITTAPKNIVTTQITTVTKNIVTTQITTVPKNIVTTRITTIPKAIINTQITTVPKTIITSHFTTPNTITTTELKIPSIIETNNNLEIIYPEEYYKNPDNCPNVYNNKCVSQCPEGTCITQEDPNLILCVPTTENMKVFNHICFINLEQITKNLKYLSDNKIINTTESGIIIRVYSTKSKDDIENNLNYSILYLGECENLLIDYYNLTEDEELYILGIDSPNKNKSYVIKVYNYEIYLENGTKLDHLKVCEDSQISISSAIIEPDLVKIDDASYFSDLGYDIYNESNNFYTDYCSPASIDGNDITLEDRKKYFSTSNVSLCNESCLYSDVNLTTKRFTCDCDISYNYTKDKNIEENNEEEEKEEEDDISYLDYFLSLINYKIIVCYELFFKFKSYYYNAGFYIAFGTLLLCFCGMIIYLKWGLMNLNKQILDNMPNKAKLIELLRENNQKRKTLINFMKNNKNNPPRNNKSKSLSLNKFKNISILFNKFSHKNDNSKHIKNKKDSDLVETKKQKDKKRILKSHKTKKIDNNKKSKKNLINESYISSAKEDKFRKKEKRKFKSLILKDINFKDQKKTNSDNDKSELNLKHKRTSKFLKYRKIDKDKSKNKRKSQKSISIFIKNTSKDKIINNFYFNNKSAYKSSKRIKRNNFKNMGFIRDEGVDKKELNTIPFTQALRIDNRNFFEIFLSVLIHEVKIMSIFYYRSPFSHLSITLSIYLFELCLDLTLNCLLYTDDVVSQKYNNNGSITFFTSLSLSFMSNIFASIISFIVGKLIDYNEILELIIRDVAFKNQYLLNIVKFKKYLILKLIGFYLVQTIINLSMCYYLMIFCTVYNKTQGSIMLNYLLGIAESMAISLGFTIIISLIRFLSLKYKSKYLYYTSKYLFENF